MKGFIEKLEELLELGGTKRDLKRPCIAFHQIQYLVHILKF